MGARVPVLPSNDHPNPTQSCQKVFKKKKKKKSKLSKCGAQSPHHPNQNPTAEDPKFFGFKIENSKNSMISGGERTGGGGQNVRFLPTTTPKRYPATGGLRGQNHKIHWGISLKIQLYTLGCATRCHPKGGCYLIKKQTNANQRYCTPQSGINASLFSMPNLVKPQDTHCV